MSDISVRTLTTSGTTTYVSGTSSGLDTDSLVENAVAAYTAEADTIDIKVEENQTKIDAYEEYYGLAEALQDSLENLKSITSLSGTEDSVFEARTGSLSSNGTDPSGLISATIDDGAPQGSYEITVQQKAEEMIIQGASVSSDSDPLGYSGTFEIGLEDGETATITITTDMSLEDIEAAINATTDTSHVSASILKTSEDSYQLVITGGETNKSITLSTTSGSALGPTGLGITDGSDTILEDQIAQEAQGSIILFNSTQITRDDNNYDDLIEGGSFDILAADEDTTITLTVEYDTSSAKEAISNFVDTYNALREFVITNQTVNSDGSIPDDAALFSEPLLETLAYSLTSLIANASYDDSNVQTIRDIGISFDADNVLIIDDETALDEALLNNFADVASFFSTQVTTGNSDLRLITNSSSQTELDFEIDITVNEDGDVVSATVDGKNMFEISGSRIIGVDGTDYEGLTFAYAGDEDATISVSLTAGLADLIYNTVDAYTNSSDGLIQSEIDALQGTNDDLEAEAEEIRERGEEIREREIEKYAEMEAKLELAKNLLSQIQAILGSDDD